MKKLLFVSSTIVCCIFGNSLQSFADKEIPSSGPIVKQPDASHSTSPEIITDGNPTKTYPSDEERNKTDKADTNLNKGLIRSSKIKGMNVKNMQDENLGKIEEIMFDRTQGKIAYLVLSFGGFLGMGDKFFAMPVHIFNYDAHEDCYRIDINKGKLKKSPGFDKDHWPSSSDSYWIKEVNDHYK
ncbi:MAG: PRC-barrel domain-containing protein [Parachlamydiaceae bacterium]|nr:PRC-barrel domain-containing protein [Parachlamydiaceae bacterium]